MISPTERSQNPILSLPSVPITALLVYVNRDGDIEARDGHLGEVIRENAVTISEGALWVRENGDVVQHYPRGNHLLGFPGLVKAQTVSLEDVNLVVANFSGGILGASRAMHYATARVLTDLEAFQGLVTLSDEALNHAIGSNLKEQVSVQQHRENVAELEALVRSGGELADEIRTFLERLKDPKDKRKRHNAYRMVLMVRAVQRRAKAIREGKGDTLEAVTEIGLDVARYVGAVTATASKIITELEDEQPWWTGHAGFLSHRTAVQRRSNFIVRLRQYRTELLAITAKPFRRHMLTAAQRMEVLALWMESGQYRDVHTGARSIISLMETVLEQERDSRSILTTRHAP